jgi:hypothetical protein
MAEIKTEIQINAPASAVWSLLTDFNNWKSWNPTINEISGEASLNSKLSITMRCEDGKNGNKYPAQITALEKSKTLRWHAKMGFDFLFSNDRIFELKESDSGTLLTNTEVFGGLMGKVMGGKMDKSVRPMLESMNVGLKKKAEGN